MNPSISTDPDQAHGRLGRRRDEAREQAILDAALELIAEVGYDRMSMDALAARAKASKATIYRRWPGKAQLVVEALRRRTCLEPHAVDTGRLRGDLLGVVGIVSDNMCSVDGPLMTGIMQASRSDPELAEVLRTTMGAVKERMWAAIVERAVGRGELPPAADPHVLGEVASAMLCSRQLVGDDRSEDEFGCHLVDDILIPLLKTSHIAPV